MAANRSPIPGTPTEWTPTPLASIALKVGSGATPRGGSTVYLPERERWALVRSQNVFDRQFNEDGLAFITDEAADELSGVALEVDDILLNITGDGITFARACAVPADVLPACVNQHVVRIRCDRKKCEPGYLLSYLTHPLVKPYIESFNAGGSRRAITKGNIESFIIPLPPPATQRAIAGVLGALDDKIEVNRRIARTLEAAARALFESWFVRFEHPSAKATAAGSIDSPLRTDSPVPKGWSVATPWDAFEVNPTRTLARDSDAAYLDMSNMPTQGHAPESWVRRSVGSGMKFINGDTLVARITPCLENGKTAFVDFLENGEVGWGSTEYIVMRPKPPLPLVFAYCLARSSEFRTFAIRQMSGSSGRQRVPAESLRQFFFAVPPAPIAEEFGRAVEPTFARIKAAMEQNRTLAAARDALLPRLMSGELAVPEALGRAD